jgi:hypothetical protein
MKRPFSGKPLTDNQRVHTVPILGTTIGTVRAQEILTVKDLEKFLQIDVKTRPMCQPPLNQVVCLQRLNAVSE